jgi:hypothetical protein
LNTCRLNHYIYIVLLVGITRRQPSCAASALARVHSIAVQARHDQPFANPTKRCFAQAVTRCLMHRALLLRTRWKSYLPILRSPNDQQQGFNCKAVETQRRSKRIPHRCVSTTFMTRVYVLGMPPMGVETSDAGSQRIRASILFSLQRNYRDIACSAVHQFEIPRASVLSLVTSRPCKGVSVGRK